METYYCDLILWGKKLSLSGTPDFISFGEFIITPVYCRYSLPNLSVLGLCLHVHINDFGLLL